MMIDIASILSVGFYILVTVVVLSFLVVIHELGHFLSAKFFKVTVEEFGIGYPPRALALFKWKGTLFSLNWIPFGGFVRMEGEDGEGDRSEQAVGSSEGAFYTKSVFARLVVILAGAFVNFVFGVIAFTIVFFSIGIPLSEARISEVQPDSPAFEAGVPTNVDIIAMKFSESTIQIDSFAQVMETVAQHPGETVTLVTTGTCNGFSCQEMAQEFEVYIRTDEEKQTGEGSMGVVFESFAKPQGIQRFTMSATLGFTQAVDLAVQTPAYLYDAFKKLITKGVVPKDLQGPIGVVKYTATENMFAGGIIPIILFAGSISINLAVMNVLPIPALDGGRAFFILIEMLLGKKFVEKFEQQANVAGYIILLSLIVLISVKDIWYLFN